LAVKLNLIRLLLTIMFLPAFVLLVRGTGTRSRALRGIAVLIGVGGASIIINQPRIISRAASELGISSGGDLVLYAVVVALTTFVGYALGKFRRVEQRLNTVVHELAVISEKVEPGSRNSKS